MVDRSLVNSMVPVGVTRFTRASGKSYAFRREAALRKGYVASRVNALLLHSHPAIDRYCLTRYVARCIGREKYGDAF